MAARIVAVLVAAAMVVGALAWRNRDDGGENGGGRVASGPLRLTCTPELEQVCGALDDALDDLVVNVEPAGDTADRLVELGAADDLPLDGWLTPGPWPAMVTELRRGDAVLEAPSEPVGRSPLHVAVWKDRAAALDRFCPGEAITWRCLGDAASARRWAAAGGQETWGDVHLGFGDPQRDAGGLLALGATTAAFFDTPDVASVELETNDEYREWARALARSSRRVSIEEMLAVGPASVAALPGPAATLAAVVRASQRSDAVSLLYPEPRVSADMMVGLAQGRRGDRLAEFLGSDDARAVLAEAGWQDPPEGQPVALSPALLLNLRTTWAQVAR